jgi:hypothetical protein
MPYYGAFPAENEESLKKYKTIGVEDLRVTVPSSMP